LGEFVNFRRSQAQKFSKIGPKYQLFLRAWLYIYRRLGLLNRLTLEKTKFLGILAKEFTERLAITWAGKRRTTLPASYRVGIGAIDRPRYITKRPSTSFSFAFETLISHRPLACLIGSHVYVLFIIRAIVPPYGTIVFVPLIEYQKQNDVAHEK
jgi:hypothetical protein